MDAASAAAMSDPERNRWFRRRWVEPATIPPPAATRQDIVPQSLEATSLHLRETWRQERDRGQSAMIDLPAVRTDR